MNLPKEIIQEIHNLTYVEKQTLYEIIKDEIFPNNYDDSIINEVRDSRFDDGFVYPHCSSKEIVSYGKYNGRQKYKCKACNKYFSDFTGTPMA